jgi:hypothetical protein
MPSYTDKKLTLKKTEIVEAAPEVVEAPPAEDKPIEIEPEFVSIAGLASKGREALLDQLRQHMEKGKQEEYVPPQPTARQLTQTQLEMEAGRRASERAAAQAAMYKKMEKDKSEGYTTPVFRPADHVPGFDAADPRAQTLK